MDKNLEIQELPYKITLHALHGLYDIGDNQKLEMILHDSAFKASALFLAISNLANMAKGGHHKFCSEEMFGCLDELGQIGKSICDSVITPIETLMDKISEGKQDA